MRHFLVISVFLALLVVSVTQLKKPIEKIIEVPKEVIREVPVEKEIIREIDKPVYVDRVVYRDVVKKVPY